MPKMTRAQADALWREATANVQRLRDCPGPHAFDDLTPERSFGKRFRCRTCGGELGQVERLAYEQGLAHGRRR